MTLDADEIVVGANGKVWVGPTTATAPTNATTAMADPWADVGLISGDGVTFTPSVTITDIDAWQSPYPVRSIPTNRDLTLGWVMRQWNAATVSLALGGTISGSGPYTFTPFGPEVLDERSIVMEWQDDEKDYRLYVPKGLVTETAAITLARTSAADLGVTFSVRPTAGDDAFLIFSDDGAFADLGTGS